MTRVVGYARVSTVKQAEEGHSLAAQSAKLRAYCVANDLELVHVYSDCGVSAGSLDRPALRAALAAIDRGEAGGIVVTKLDRLTRRVQDLGALIQGGAGTRYALHSLSDSINTSTASGRLVLNVLVSVSEWERDAAKERTRETMDHMRAEGRHVGGVPFGWRVVDGRLVPDVQEQSEIAAMRLRRSQGASYWAIAAELATGTLRGPRGGAWTATAVRRCVTRMGAMP